MKDSNQAQGKSKSFRMSDLKSGLALAGLEWSALLLSTLQYKIQETAATLEILLPDSLSAKNWATQMKMITDRGTIARLKLGRILVRLFSASLNKNRRAFEHALNDLIDLGKLVA